MSVSWYGCTLTVEWAPDDDPLTATGSCTWSDITAYVRSYNINRGRTSELSTYSPGSMSITLSNLARVFDPTNTAGTYYGKLLPMKRIRVKIVAGAVTGFVFTGYVLGWPITYPGMTDSVVTVQCVDAFRILEQAAQPGSAYGCEVLADDPDYYWPMQSVDGTGTIPAAVGGLDIPGRPDLSPWTTSTSTLPIGESTTLVGNGGFAGGSVSVTPPSFPAAVEFQVSSGIATVAAPGTSVRVSSTDFFSVSVDESQVNVGYSHGGKMMSTGAHVAFESSAVSSASHVFVTASSTTITVYVNGIAIGTDTLTAGSYSTTFSGQVPGIGVGGDTVKGLAHVAYYATAPSASRIQAHYLAGLHAYGHPYGERVKARMDRVLDSIGWAAADRDLSQGETVLGNWEPGGGSALSEARGIEAVEQGLFYIAGDGDITFRDRQWQLTNTKAVTSQATFGDSGSEIYYRDITIDGNEIGPLRNVVTVSYDGGSVTVKDATSITAYGTQADSVNASAAPTWFGWLARQLGNFRLRARKDPITRVPSVVIDPRAGSVSGSAATNLAIMLPLDIGYRVTVKRRPPNGTGSFSQAVAIQGTRIQMSPAQCSFSYYLAPAPESYTEAPYWTAGDATRGKPGAVAANLISY